MRVRALPTKNTFIEFPVAVGQLDSFSPAVDGLRPYTTPAWMQASVDASLREAVKADMDVMGGVPSRTPSPSPTHAGRMGRPLLARAQTCPTQAADPIPRDYDYQEDTSQFGFALDQEASGLAPMADWGECGMMDGAQFSYQVGPMEGFRPVASWG